MFKLLSGTDSNHFIKQHTSVNNSEEQLQESNHILSQSKGSLKRKSHYMVLALKLVPLTFIVILIATLSILKFAIPILQSLTKTSRCPESTIRDASESPSHSMKDQFSKESKMDSNKRWRREGGRLIRRSNQRSSLDSIQSLNTTASIIFRRTRDDYHNSITTLNSSSSSNIFF